eukprot:6458261-Amphidinium_carterae.2
MSLAMQSAAILRHRDRMLSTHLLMLLAKLGMKTFYFTSHQNKGEEGPIVYLMERHGELVTCADLLETPNAEELLKMTMETVTPREWKFSDSVLLAHAPVEKSKIVATPVTLSCMARRVQVNGWSWQIENNRGSEVKSSQEGKKDYNMSCKLVADSILRLPWFLVELFTAEAVMMLTVQGTVCMSMGLGSASYLSEAFAWQFAIGEL